MTPQPAQQPQQEKYFLISEWELDRMFTNSDNDELLEKIRSHPAPASTPAIGEQTDTLIMMRKDYEISKAQARAEGAREV